jgi:hypothetical protein
MTNKAELTLLSYSSNQIPSLTYFYLSTGYKEVKFLEVWFREVYSMHIYIIVFYVNIGIVKISHIFLVS